MVRNLLLALIIATGLAPKALAAEPAPPPWFADVALYLNQADVRYVPAALPAVASPGLEEKAAHHARRLARAIAYFERELHVSLPLRLVVLDRQGWTKATEIPYPAPHVNYPLFRLIFMPESLSQYPGFEQWGFDDTALNEMLAVHEIGHAAAIELGLRWHSVNFSTHELLANVMMAAYIRNEAPQMKRLLAGPPPGFALTNRLGLSDLDYSYIGLGLREYAWFQFQLAMLADQIAAGRPLGSLLPVLQQELAESAGDMPGSIFARLENTTPGLKALAEPLLRESIYPELPLEACAPPRNLPGAGRAVDVILENRSGREIAYSDPASIRNFVKDYAEFNASLNDAGENLTSMIGELMASKRPTIGPGRWQRLSTRPGGVIVMEDRGCIYAAVGPGRFAFRN